MYHCGMRQVGERHVPYQVDLMVWSNRLDLLALSNFKGEVQIHRLHWQKVWNVPSPEENVSVRAMAWRPDGKALAIGYSSGTVFIVDIENKEILDKYILEKETIDDYDTAKHSGVTCITWAVRSNILESATEYNLYDDTSIFLQKLPQLSGYKPKSRDENVKDFKEIQEPTQLNMLLVGYGTGYIYMNIFGRYPYGTIHLAEISKDDFGEYKVLDINLSDDFSIMEVLYIDRYSNNVLLSLINTSVLSAYAEEMFIVARKHGHIVQLLAYLDQTMISITEAWEHILLEMDTKLASYAANVADGDVSADLLELLMLGTASDALQVFLSNLTANDLKKFGNSVELSYSTIQKLVLKQLTIVGQSLTYYLAELRGLTRVPDRYKILGINESTVTAAIKACCAFLNKSLELQQIIDISMKNYKAFFRWLFVVIVRLLDEPTPSEIVKITQQELSHIAEFLYNFATVNAGKKHNSQKPVKFNLERLGQYLQDEDLTILPDDEDNPWHKFLKENSCLLKDNDTIFSMTEFRKFSLIQQQKYLKNAIAKVFDVSRKETGKYFSILHNIRCYEDQISNKIGDSLRISQTFDAKEKRFMIAFMNTNCGQEGIYFMSVDMKETAVTATAMKYYLSSSLLQDNRDESNEEQIVVLDLQFYSAEYLSVLTKHPYNEESTIYIQVPLKILMDNSNDFSIKSKSYLFCDNLSKKNISPLLDLGVFKVLDKIDGFRIAVSGGRKVAIVLAKSMRKVRVFEMEIDGDEDEDETLDTTPLSNSQGTPDKQNTPSEDITF